MMNYNKFMSLTPKELNKLENPFEIARMKRDGTYKQPPPILDSQEKIKIVKGPKDVIICEVCDKTYTRCNFSAHCKTKHHKLHSNILKKNWDYYMGRN